jgi:hypothetical protein
VLRPGGRLAISDVVATAELPDEVKDDPHLHACCVAGAALVDELQTMLEEANFSEIRATPKMSRASSSVTGCRVAAWKTM